MLSRRPGCYLLNFIAVPLIGMSFVISALAEKPLVLADPTVPLKLAWTHRQFNGATHYTRLRIDGVMAIRAIGRNSASGLYREAGYEVVDHPWLEWTWRVERLQQSADVRLKDREDFAAAVFLIFGRPSLFNRDVPSLVYIWTNDRLPKGAIVESPYHPGSVRDIVVRSGEADRGQWVHERRNVVEDFREAFGRKPPATVEVVALFTDNDQTGEPVEAYYGPVKALPG